MILTRFYNTKHSDPTELNLDKVPHVGDELTLNNPSVYIVESIRWQLTSEGLREACLTLKYKGDA